MASFINVKLQNVLHLSPIRELAIEIQLTKILSGLFDDVIDEIPLNGWCGQSNMVFGVRIIVLVSRKIKIVILFAI